jgi:hypothetical protein
VTSITASEPITTNGTTKRTNGSTPTVEEDVTGLNLIFSSVDNLMELDQV